MLRPRQRPRRLQPWHIAEHLHCFPPMRFMSSLGAGQVIRCWPSPFRSATSCARSMCRCTTIDPRPAKLSRAQRAALQRRDGSQQPAQAAHLQAEFGPALWDDPEHAALLADCSLVVGMHPDQVWFLPASVALRRSSVCASLSSPAYQQPSHHPSVCLQATHAAASSPQ